MKQLKISLSDDLRAVLEAASSKAGHSLGEEIRRRIALTTYFDRQNKLEDFDQQTIELAEDVMHLARYITADAKLLWHAHPKTHEALAAALIEWLKIIRPESSEVVTVSDLFAPDDPEALGRAIAQSHRRAKEMSNRSFREVQDLRRRKRVAVASKHAKKEGKR